MTELLFFKDCYVKEFDSKIIENNGDYVVLDKTAFYPISGGQPSDTGFLNNSKVIEVRKKDGKIMHFVDKPVESLEVHGIIDWDKRYKHMRMHTAQHLISAIILDKWGASTVGNNISYDKSRLDFIPFKPDKEDLEYIKKKFNGYVDARIEVKIYEESREEVMRTVDERRRKLFDRVPVQKVRIIEIVGLDKCPCGGTHVKNTSEIGHINILDVVNKGKEITRLSFELI